MVIGRNQNPWLEVNLNLIGRPAPSQMHGYQTGQYLSNVHLVRRRSGGGTVFHDDGNVNYSVICPTADFTRDKHAEMVVRAIRKNNPRARVNERHDIVLDHSVLQDERYWPEADDMHKTRYSHLDDRFPSVKVSGSAYKLTRQRSLHHGTCLLSSPNLGSISQYLHSPARPYMKARGVESVRSLVGNVYEKSATPSSDSIQVFQRQVMDEFTELYAISKKVLAPFSTSALQPKLHADGEWTSGYVGESVTDIAEIRAGTEELKVNGSCHLHPSDSYP